jgi:formylglycine-generating enzyme required for sulfatase activity
MSGARTGSEPMRAGAQGDPTEDPTGASWGYCRVARGGHRQDGALCLRSAYRAYDTPENYYHYNYGLRLTRS